MPPNTETLIPQLIADYATTRRTDLSLPDATALPFIVAPYEGEQLFPRVVFVTTSASSPHPKRMNLTVSVELQTSAEDQGTTEENTWAAGLRYILADVAAFQTWLQAQTLTVRTGYRIRKYKIAQDVAGMGIEDRQRGRKTEIMVNVRTDELAPVSA